jgi:hypothetical protein
LPKKPATSSAATSSRKGRGSDAKTKDRGWRIEDRG